MRTSLSSNLFTQRYLFTFPEINCEKTHSKSQDGMSYIFVELADNVKDKNIVWSKIKHGINLFKQSSLPSGVLAVIANDNFVDVAAPANILNPFFRRRWQSTNSPTTAYYILLPPVFFRRNANYPFEIFPEKRLRRKVQLLADLQDGHVGSPKQRFSFQNLIIVYPLERRLAGRFLDNGG
jgi:hypothetical protein